LNHDRISGSAADHEEVWMKKLAFLSAIVFVLCFISPGHAEMRIGYVNLQTAITKSEKGKAARAKLNELLDEKKTYINKMSEEIETLQETVDKQAHLYTEEARRQKLAEIDVKQREYSRLVSRFEEDLKWAEQDLVEQLTRELRPLVEEVGKRDGFSFIFEYSPNRWLYVDKGLDITDRVIEEFNKHN